MGGGEALKYRHSQKVLFSPLIVPAEVVPGGTLRWSATCVSGVGRLYPPSPPPQLQELSERAHRGNTLSPHKASALSLLTLLA